MTYVIFIGDLLVTGFMIALFVWVSMRARGEELDACARIPLEDEAEPRRPAAAPDAVGTGKPHG